MTGHYYIQHPSIATYNDHLRPMMSDIELLRLFSLSHEPGTRAEALYCQFNAGASPSVETVHAVAPVRWFVSGRGKSSCVERTRRPSDDARGASLQVQVHPGERGGEGGNAEPASLTFGAGVKSNCKARCSKLQQLSHKLMPSARQKLVERVPVPVKGSTDEPSSKVNVLLQAALRVTCEGQEGKANKKATKSESCAGQLLALPRQVQFLRHRAAEWVPQPGKGLHLEAEVGGLRADVRHGLRHPPCRNQSS